MIPMRRTTTAFNGQTVDAGRCAEIKMIKITLEEYEINDPEKGNYFYLRGKVADEGYAGWSDIVVAEEDLKAFFEDLNNFAKDFKGTPELKTGWGRRRISEFALRNGGRRARCGLTGKSLPLREQRLLLILHARIDLSLAFPRNPAS